MQPRAKAKGTTTPPCEVGLFSKKEAAAFIAGGVHHVHSTKLAQRDSCVITTSESIARQQLPTYPWERTDGTTYVLQASKLRLDLIKQICEEHGKKWKRDMKDKVNGVVEELSTNALYHSYHLPDGKPKYARKAAMQLTDAEKITLRVKSSDEGVYLSIRDQGGSFDFNAVASAFHRCYGAAQQQIELKEGGAGLGVYMVFEAVTHLKIVCSPGRYTEISCWIADHKHFDPEHFSFNFIEWR